MNDSTSPLTPSQLRAKYWQAINQALHSKLIDSIIYERRAFLGRAGRALKRNLAEPGDCAGDIKLLIGLSLAEAQVGRSPGWIPEVQRLEVKIAELI